MHTTAVRSLIQKHIPALQENISFEIINLSTKTANLSVRHTKMLRRFRMEVLFVIWAGIIPLVPLIGVQLFKQRCDKRKAAVCRLLFFGQAILSLTYIAVYFGIIG